MIEFKTYQEGLEWERTRNIEFRILQALFGSKKWRTANQVYDLAIDKLHKDKNQVEAPGQTYEMQKAMLDEVIKNQKKRSI